jgi:hypothetical protein
MELTHFDEIVSDVRRVVVDHHKRKFNCQLNLLAWITCIKIIAYNKSPHIYS